MAYDPFLVTVNGIFSIVITIFFFFVGIKIALIYKKSNEKVHLLVGMTWIMLSSAWWSSASSFITSLFNGGQGFMIVPFNLIYFILAIVPLPIAAFIWMSGFTEILFTEKKEIIRLIFLVMGIVVEIWFIIYMIVDPARIVDVTTPVNGDYSRLILIYIIFLLIVIFFTGIFLARTSIKMGTPENKLKGYFLILAFILYVVGAVFDSMGEFTDLLLLVPRFIILLSALCFYLGFVTPNSVKKLFLKS